MDNPLVKRPDDYVSDCDQTIHWLPKSNKVSLLFCKETWGRGFCDISFQCFKHMMASKDGIFLRK